MLESRVEGTQTLDGFFATFRRLVGRLPFNTTGPRLEPAAKLEKYLCGHPARVYPEPSSSSRPVAQRSVAAVEPEEVPSAAESEVFSELYNPSL